MCITAISPKIPPRNFKCNLESTWHSDLPLILLSGNQTAYLGLRSVSETPYEVKPHSHDGVIWIHNFVLTDPEDNSTHKQIPVRNQCRLVCQAGNAIQRRDLRKAIAAPRSVTVNFHDAIGAAVRDPDEVGDCARVAD